MDYGPSLEFAIPQEIATFENSGYKFVAWHEVGSVKDKDSGEVKNYVILEKKISNYDTDIDFDRIYAVAWILKVIRIIQYSRNQIIVAKSRFASRPTEMTAAP